MTLEALAAGFISISCKLKTERTQMPKLKLELSLKQYTGTF